MILGFCIYIYIYIYIYIFKRIQKNDKLLDEQYNTNSSQLDYQKIFGWQNVMQPLNAEAKVILPEYQNIASIPKVGDPNEKFGEPPLQENPFLATTKVVA